ncbi:glucose-6-phosphate isomerase, cytosolic 2 [Saprolegnia diclina VS20]|uniref:Glucose-6-phosphate isomerase n=1 Tax=Saprolegnia diclina (strain VS20) TaxID=1156394 RepID=T0QAG3_SAPDV|nr:glucose-6-phosphate isomerase, cytosolic 2 [Saprolegnia diclina VS20]EQC34889.1 glucose-6-phosphate isomerase, cytosolic 2 [Saprolegnia diclina VS20]|eukprot:XP_008611761.1 glucose-6-phosphate isomerase, cytosolic 2 [Saprolegnia diclina VS20]
MINDTPQWTRLTAHADAIKATHLRTLLKDEARNAALVAEHNGITLDYSRQNATLETMDLLFDLAEAAQLRQKLAAIASGEHVNKTEDRAVMHMALRSPATKPMYVDGKNVVEDVHDVLRAIRKFSDRVRSGVAHGATGKKLLNVVSIGIGGSYLGPEYVFEALRHEKVAKAAAAGRTLRFLANVDPVDAARAVEGLNPEDTLVVVVSKTFTTAETMLNARTLRKWLVDGLAAHGVSAADAIRHHMIAVSAAVPKAQEFGIAPENVFGFWDWVGGRYSVCSAVGIVPLALHYGADITDAFLAGAHDLDEHLLNAPLRENLPVLLGLLGIWNSSFLGHATRAMLPYAQALLRFAAHIQQVDMESNGKRVALDGSVLPFAAGEINFGEPGTNGQHSFYQLIHQGRVVPCDFIAFCKSQTPTHLSGEKVSNHDELMSNFFAQPDALANGKTVEELAAEGVPEALRPHKAFPGNRPSVSLLFHGSLDAFACGQLLALYEHRTVVQGAIWGLNSFDQWGVELGKVLATQVRNQLSASRTNAAAPLQGFNSSTSALLKRYLA